ncbi:phytanoyl-CoA dioxygenase family protein [Sphingobium sp. EP60837]|uniref:phytanoyl-CoA dioxygenase family protein n=1 Tax=Sphingobium sp. EP60837 TaxID=1855519 RepID=UPI0007DCF699|nr:phytanoyl-CoA dioxygenase family protein [Sphingobium sp. EP60837]ANI79260.1 hypothetical protein EP837_02866 [Sphingobium sp. EP60837]
METSLRQRYQEDGAVLIKNCLNQEQLDKCREVFDWAVANPGPHAFNIFDGTEHQTHNDNSNPNAKERIDALVETLPFGNIYADLWGSEHVWLFAEEVFMKSGGKPGRSPWHQDTSYLPWGGQHWGNTWISFESVPKKNALEVVRGSHHGIRYDGTTFLNPQDPTEPLHGHQSVPALPRLPDIEAIRARDPKAFDILSWATEPGDVLFVHPRCLHGGAPVDAEFPERHTIVFRFFGDDATFDELPVQSASGYDRNGVLFVEEMAKMKQGEPFRSPIFRQLA